MTNLREAAQMALDALEWCYDVTEWPANGKTPQDKAIEALRAALAQPEPEPVAWADKYDIEREGHDFYANRQQPAKDGVSLYTAQPQREWQGLTDEEIDELAEANLDFNWKDGVEDFARAIEAKLKEKNT